MRWQLGSLIRVALGDHAMSCNAMQVSVQCNQQHSISASHLRRDNARRITHVIAKRFTSEVQIPEPASTIGGLIRRARVGSASDLQLLSITSKLGSHLNGWQLGEWFATLPCSSCPSPVCLPSSAAILATITAPTNRICRSSCDLPRAGPMTICP